MRIVYLLETAAQLWGGVKSVLEDANSLTDRDHQVTVLSKSEPPDWMPLRCGFRRVPDFGWQYVPDSDLVVGTLWNTVPFAVSSGKGVAVHYCQGYEGDNPENAARRAQIEAIYAMPETWKITISPHLARMWRERFGQAAREVTYAIDHRVMRPGERPRGQKPVRIGLVGPYQIAWKDIRTGLEACALAHRAGLDLQLVRITNTTPHPAERDLPYPVEWHERVKPVEMGELYRSMDAFLGTSSGAEEGFFLPAVEAMACGVPCVLTDVPCFRGYGEGEYALFVEPRNAMQMAEAMVIASSHPTVAEALRQQGPRIAARFRAESHVQELEEAFTEILKTTRASALGSGPARSTTVERTVEEKDLQALTQSVTDLLRGTSEAWLAAGHYRSAARHLEAALQIQPDSTDVLQQLAYARYLAEDDTGALAAYDRLLELGVRHQDVLANRGMVLFSRGEMAAAAQAFEQAIAAGPATAEIWNNLGVARHQLADHAGARVCFEKALQIDAGCADAAANLQRLARQ